MYEITETEFDYDLDTYVSYIALHIYRCHNTNWSSKITPNKVLCHRYHVLFDYNVNEPFRLCIN